MSFDPVIPRHVAACMHSPDKRTRWALHLWPKSDNRTMTRIPYCCGSWRCKVCRRHEAAVTFARIKEACEPLDPSGWCLIVLTLDRDGYYSGQPWHDVTAAYASLGTMTRAFLDRIGRRWGPETVQRSGRRGVSSERKLGKNWVSVVEAHRSGWPHVNLLVWCPDLARELAAERDQRLENPEVANAVALARDAWKNGEPLPERERALARRATVLGAELVALAEECGWGRESTAEAARSADSVAGYIVKMAGHHDASVGELAKITQAPLNAPARFRRLRSGKGFLPPRHKNAEITGCLVRSRKSGYNAKSEWRGAGADWEIEPVNPPKDIAMLEPIARARAAEFAFIEAEEAALSSKTGLKLAPLCPADVRAYRRRRRMRETSERNAALDQRARSAAG